MLVIGYVFAIRSERALCREVQLNLAYRWFCGLGIEDKIPDHSAFTRARNERFREHDIFRQVFERVVAACIKAHLVGGIGFAVDASLIAADANKCGATPGDDWSHDIDPATVERAVQDYLANLDNPAWGAATDVVPKFVAPADPAAQWTGALRNAAFFAYADNYLIDVKFGIIMDVEASHAIRQAEVGASQIMIERTEATFGIKPDWLAADTAYGSAPNLHFLVDEKDIAPHIPAIDKSRRVDGMFSREDFIYDEAHDCYICLNGKILPRSSGARGSRGDDMISYFLRVVDCRDCQLKPRCCPNSPSRKITRHIHEAARDVAREIAKTAARRPVRAIAGGQGAECASECANSISTFLRSRRLARRRRFWAIAAIVNSNCACHAARCVASRCVGRVRRRFACVAAAHAGQAARASPIFKQKRSRLKASTPPTSATKSALLRLGAMSDLRPQSALKRTSAISIL